jgi:hypothetical protein|nr:MAG: hypothetical protein [Lake Baikal virophage 15]
MKCRMCSQTKSENDFVLRGKKLTSTCIQCSELRKKKDYCPCGVREHDCTNCRDPIIRRATSMIHSSRIADKKHNLTNDLTFLEVLHKIIDTPLCTYCNIEMQYVAPYLPNHATIDRIYDIDVSGNYMPHFKTNCCISCRSCNSSQRKFLQPNYWNIIKNINRT